MNSIKKSPIDDNQMRNKGKNTLRNNVGKSDPFNEFSLNVSDLSLAKCPVHKEMREIILLSEVDKFQKFERICVQCESEIKRNFPGKVNSELYNVIIEQNKEKIKKIKTMNVNIDLTDNSNLGQKALNFSNESIEPIADEILDLVDSLNNQIITKLVDNGDKLKFQELKEFINNMPFNNLGDPNLNLIGENQSLKAKYVALAIFLLKHNTDSGLNLSKSINSVNLSKLLIEYLKEITRLRKHIMSKFTDWLRFLTGDFYDYIFTLDRNDIDFNFRNSFQIDFINEEDLMRMKSLLELELRKRDDKLSSLFAENEQFRLELESLRGSLRGYSDQESYYNNLKLKLSQYEHEINSLKLSLSQVSGERDLALRKNNEYVQQIEELNRNIYNMRLDYESQTKIIIENLKNEIANLNNQIKNYVFQIKELDSNMNNYKIQLDQVRNENSGLNSQIKNSLFQINEYEVNLKNLKIQMEQLRNENNNLSLKINSINNENSSLSSQIKNYINQINSITAERDEARNQLILIKSEIDKFKNELIRISNLNVTIEGQNREMKQRYEDLLSNYNKLKLEFDNKINLISKLELQMNELANKTQAQINLQLSKINKLEADIQELIRLNEDYKSRLKIIPDKELEVEKVRNAFIPLKQEYSKIHDLYESALVDLKRQIELNELLKNLINELQAKVESHNRDNGNQEQFIKQQIDAFTKNILAKKPIEYAPINDHVRRMDAEIEGVKNKIKRNDGQVLNKNSFNLPTGNKGLYNDNNYMDGQYDRRTPQAKVKGDLVGDPNSYLNHQGMNNFGGNLVSNLTNKNI